MPTKTQMKSIKKKFPTGITPENIVDFLLSYTPVDIATYDGCSMIYRPDFDKRTTKKLVGIVDGAHDYVYVGGEDYIVVPPNKLKNLTVVMLKNSFGDMITMTEKEANALTFTPTIVIDGDDMPTFIKHLGIGYDIVLTKTHMKIGCCHFSWNQWARKTTQDDVLSKVWYAHNDTLRSDMLNAIVKNRKRIIAALS